MLPPKIIDKLKRKREERDRPAAYAPMFPLDDTHHDRMTEDEDASDIPCVIIIELS